VLQITASVLLTMIVH